MQTSSMDDNRCEMVRMRHVDLDRNLMGLRADRQSLARLAMLHDLHSEMRLRLGQERDLLESATI